jgi:hypothetical protein
MSYQQKLTEARALLEQHNSQINSATKLDVEKFFQNLANSGGTNDATLAQCTWEDLQEFGLPRLLAKQVASIFRVKEEKVEKPVLKKSKVEAMTVGELISCYDPRTPVSLVTTRLSELMDDKRFIVFNNDGSVNASVSTKLAQEVLDGYPERELYSVDDVPTKTYKIGERPDQSFDENPLYPGRVLRPDGDCDQTNRSWSGVPLEVRQTLYLSVTKTGELKINSINDAHNVLDLVVGKEDAEAVKTVRRRFAKATALLKELQQQNKAPSLKIFKKVGDSKKNDPFGVHRSY